MLYIPEPNTNKLDILKNNQVIAHLSVDSASSIGSELITKLVELGYVLKPSN